MPSLLPTRVLFLGNHNVGHDALRLLIDAGVNLVGVLAHPDSIDSRDLWYRSAKTLATRAGIPTYQPKTLKDEGALRLVRQLAPDLLLSISYGKIIPRAILDVPRFGAVNLHGSLLPEYRGRFCPVWAVMNGERQTGVTLHRIEEGIDTGDIIAQDAFPIADTDTGYSVYMRMCAYGLDLLRRTLPILLSGFYPRRPQAYVGSYYSSLSDEDRCVHWDRPTQTILNQIRACYFPPYPCSHTYYQGERYPIWRAVSNDAVGNGQPGSVIGFDRADRPLVATADGVVILLETELVRPYLSIGQFAYGFR
jgi:methionyl-tRNA formyltransferase